MALIQCKECQKEISNSAEVCPNCGFSVNKPKKQASGCFIITMVFLAFAFVFVILLNISNSGNAPSPSSPPKNISETVKKKDYMYAYKNANIRSEPNEKSEIIYKLVRGDKIEKMAFENGWYKVKHNEQIGYVDAKLLISNPLPNVEIVDWSWSADPDFGGNGAIIWRVELRNNTQNYIKMVKVEISIYDKNGNLTESDYTYVQGLAPGGTGSDKSYATYYGTEKTASVRIVD